MADGDVLMIKQDRWYGLNVEEGKMVDLSTGKVVINADDWLHQLGKRPLEYGGGYVIEDEKIKRALLAFNEQHKAV